MKGLLLASAAALICAASAQAGMSTKSGLRDGYAADFRTGWYVSLQAGGNWLEDENIKGQGTVLPCGGFCVWTDNNPYGGIQFESGLSTAGAVGYAWGSNWNLELELAYRHNDIDCLTGAAITCATYKAGWTPGRVWQFSQFVNVRYDIPVTHDFYVGLGAGLGGTLVNVEDENGFHDDDYVLSGQLIGQIGYHIAHRWDLFLDYRYMVVDEPDLTNLTYVGGKLDISSYDLRNHSVMLGLRFDLQEDCCAPAPPPPTPAPPPPAAPEVPREYIVFFGFNKSNLTADAQKVVAEAAAAAARFNADKVVVVGHADTVGSPRYNMELSERRAETVKAELIRQGVNPAKIAATGRGEGDPLVQTGDNMREPQNRRASITIMIKAASH